MLKNNELGTIKNDLDGKNVRNKKSQSTQYETLFGECTAASPKWV